MNTQEKINSLIEKYKNRKLSKESIWLLLKEFSMITIEPSKLKEVFELINNKAMEDIKINTMSLYRPIDNY